MVEETPCHADLDYAGAGIAGWCADPSLDCPRCDRLGGKNPLCVQVAIEVREKTLVRLIILPHGLVQFKVTTRVKRDRARRGHLDSQAIQSRNGIGCLEG